MRRVIAARWLFAACGAALLGGCGTIRSNLYEADETGERKAKHLRGMPVTLEVPTHLKVSLDETHYFDDKLKPVAMRPTYELRYEVIKSKELYTTDFKRPPSGSVDLKLGLSPDKRYFTSVSQDTVDTTITDVAALVQTVITRSPVLFPVKVVGNADAAVAPPTPGLKSVKVTVAEDVFDIRQPNLEGRVQAFYDEQLNRCAARCDGGGGACPAVLPRQ